MTTEKRISMARLPAAILAATVAAGCGTAAYAQDATAQKTAGQPSAEELQLKIEELQAQVKRLAEETAAIKENPEPQAKPASGGTTYQFGGFVKMDSAISDYSDGTNATAGIGEDFLVASTIPVGGESGDAKFHAHAKTSRLFFKSSTDLGGGSAVKTHIEIDAIASGQGDERISNSYSQRLRHAFVDWQIDANRSLLAGQSWSTFFNVGALPEGMDFVGPVGTIFERQPQLRYTHKIGSGSIQIAAENPATTLYNGTQNPYDDNSSPDIVLRYNNSLGGLNYSVASMSRELAYEVGTDRESKRGYAISLSGKYQFGKDDIRFMYNYGNAIGRYMGLNAFRGGAIDATGDIDLIDQSGGYVAFRHFWNSEWRSNLVLSAITADNPDYLSDSTAADYTSTHVNLLYSPTPKMTLGGEYILASKQVENFSGLLLDDEGEMRRLQFSVKYVF